jgi:hypothetical protein
MRATSARFIVVDALAAPYAEQTDYIDLETPPRPEEIIHQTFCGT